MILEGYKTYLSLAVLVLVTLYAFATGDVDTIEGLTTLAIAGGIGGLRAAKK